MSREGECVPDAVNEQDLKDARQAWILGLNLGLEPDLAAVNPRVRPVLAEQRQARVEDYAWYLLEQLGADSRRLAAAAGGCRRRIAEFHGPADERAAGYVVGVQLAEAGLRIIRKAGADADPAAHARLREEIDRRFNPEPVPYQQGPRHRHSQPRRILRRADPAWWLRRARAVRRLELVHHPAGPYDIERIDILLEGVEVGRLRHQTCPQCRQARVGKLSVNSDRQGLGLGTRALQAALARTPGYEWWTTPQYETAETYWRRAAGTTGTSFLDHHPSPWPHID
jgi:hypothetical protein